MKTLIGFLILLAGSAAPADDSAPQQQPGFMGAQSDVVRCQCSIFQDTDWQRYVVLVTTYTNGHHQNTSIGRIGPSRPTASLFHECETLIRELKAFGTCPR